MASRKQRTKANQPTNDAAKAATASDAAPVGEPRRQLELVGTTPEEPTDAEGIENSLSNPWRYLRMCTSAGRFHADITDEEAATDSFLANLRRGLDGSHHRLNTLAVELSRCGHFKAAFDERVEARTLVNDLHEWSSIALIMSRCEIPAGSVRAPFVVPKEVQDQLFRLARLGRTLACTWVELVIGGVVIQRVPTLDATPAVPGLAVLPAVSAAGPEWMTCAAAAKLLRVSTATLANARLHNPKSPDGAVGMDTRRRIWTKCGPKTVVYLRSSIVASKS